MKQIYLLLLIFCSTLNAQNNKFNKAFEVTRPDIEINEYERDSTSGALVIYEMGNSYVDRSTFRLTTEIKKKIKILSRDGFKYGTIEIPIIAREKGNREKVSNINASVFNIENGKIVKTNLEQSSVFEENYNETYNIVKFVLPNVKVGSVISFSYTLESPFMYKYKSWFFQDDIPKLYSEYNASIPGNWEYNIKLVGSQKLTTNASYLEKNCLQIANGANSACGVYKYVMEDIPAFIEEDYMTTQLNYLARIEYELKVFRGFDGTIKNYTKDWKSTDKEINKDLDLGKQLRRSSLVKGILDETITSENDKLTKAKKILEFVQDNYVWDNKFDVLNGISIKDLIKDKSGNVGEINSLLYNFLISNDIQATPILLSTRQNGFITQIYPVLSDFNYLIIKAEINNQTYFLDATDDYLSFGQIPFRCLNSYGRLLDFDNGSKWHDIDIKKYSSKQYRSELALNENLTLTGKVTYKSSGYHSLFDRRAYFNNSEAYQNRLINDNNSNIIISNFKTQDSEKRSENFEYNIDIETTPDNAGNIVYINPFLFRFFSKNPFNLQERSYPIDFGYKDTFTYAIEINIDDSFKIKEIPKDQVINLPNNKATLLLNSTANENVITLYFKLLFKEALYDPAYYDSLKSMLGNVIDIQNNSIIVLEKKE